MSIRRRRHHLEGFSSQEIVYPRKYHRLLCAATLQRFASQVRRGLRLQIPTIRGRRSSRGKVGPGLTKTVHRLVDLRPLQCRRR